MSKVAQSFSSKLCSWIAPYNIKEEVFTTDGKVVYCNVCFKHVGSDRKSQIDAHCTTDMCSAFIRADIPLSKLNCDAFRQFLEKCTEKKT
ncbi:hypothetical protein ILUMI_17101 [Ignelater luminosus]|uniref:Uncharacterized protein n=1 Tax=Ignelater luminosus TaxID=2038154 RepID=A0A8K0CRM6_IGNLU|nr:hypothetical protein ILUMI_17101 [Ignelater luminosus]